MPKLQYNTRDAGGNDIVKEVEVKQFKPHTVEFQCPICGEVSSTGYKIKDIVSASFTDWAYVGEYVCKRCADLFSLYFYCYLVDPDGIHLLNVREIKDVLTTYQNPPFMLVITTSKKKHLFYRACWNNIGSPFAVNLETETIYTTPQRMQELFDFVECLQTLGCSREQLKRGEILFTVLQKAGPKVLTKLQEELKNREIQIPLYCGQKREMTEEEALCCINLTLIV